ncbi:MAG: TetR/AcrR family transcriptional regulator [Alphaproteobacteria bacterium]|nr:MAG: TetR/AcrR family transcriptional regulator [Alphaproteobacteria bacterium]
MTDIEIAAPPKLGKREQTKANNRQAIIDAARVVFAELGYGETTIRDIIRQTGLASGTFYNYFKSKEEVFQALMDDAALRVRPALRELREKAKTREQFVRGTFESYFRFIAEDRQTQHMVRRNTGAIRVRMDTPQIIAGFDELQQDIESAIERGLLPPVDPDYLTASFVGVAFEIADRMLERDNPDVTAAIEFATNLLLAGLQAVPASKTT